MPIWKPTFVGFDTSFKTNLTNKQNLVQYVQLNFTIFKKFKQKL